MVFSSQGVVRVHTGNATFTVPPGRAVWIPPETAHTATVLDNAQLHCLFLCIDGEQAHWGLNEGRWAGCQVIEVRALLHALVMSLAEDDQDRFTSNRYKYLVELALLEIQRSPVLPLRVALPSERRLRALCANFMESPRLDRPLPELAQNVGASVSTISRLFQTEMGCSFAEWRKQVLLAQAFTLASKGQSVSQIAFELGYGSLSAFSFMVTQRMGTAPSKLLKTCHSQR